MLGPLFFAYDYHFLLCSDPRATYLFEVVPKFCVIDYVCSLQSQAYVRYME